MNPTDDDKKCGKPISRRSFLRGAGAVGAAAAVATVVAEQATRRGGMDFADADDSSLAIHSGNINLKLNINGDSRNVTVEPRTTLLTALRYHVDPPLTGTKLVCDRGNCGACTVTMDGRSVYSCMILAVDAAGKSITTIEGLEASDGTLHPIQEAFVARDAMQCGFCTPGFIMSSKALIEKNPNPSLDDVRHGCAGNLCRCGTYPHVYEAVLDASAAMRGAKRSA